MSLSQNPPHQGAWAGMNSHDMLRLPRNSPTFCTILIAFNAFATGSKVGEQSDFICCGAPRIEINLLRAHRNDAAVWLGTASMCMAGVVTQVNRHAWAVDVAGGWVTFECRERYTSNGPA